MSAALFRETAFGQVVRYVTKNRYLKYPEELDDFVVPESYGLHPHRPDHEKTRAAAAAANAKDSRIPEPVDSPSVEQPEADFKDLEKQETISESSRQHSHAMMLQRTKSRADTVSFTEERFQVDQEAAITRTKSMPIEPTVTAKGEILVDWYTTDDPSNPQNWPSGRKGLSATILW
jgi:DHA1 family multidrug resistance protein-like MFS transporter